MQFNYRPISAHEYIFNMQLRALRQHLGQFGEGTCDECLLAEVMTGKRVRSLHNPVHFVGYMLKKRGAIALLQPLENLANTLGCNGHLISPFVVHLLLPDEAVPRCLALTVPSRFVRSLAWIFSTDRTASLISPQSASSARPATSRSNFSTDSSHVNGSDASPG